MPLREKIVTLTVLWLTIGFAVAFAVSAWWGRLMLVGIASGVTIYIIRLKTRKAETGSHQNNKSDSEDELEFHPD